MSTNATISARQADGTIKTIYLHFGDNADRILNILQNFYEHQWQIEMLISLGDLSVLDESPEAEGDAHTFAYPVDGCCIAYHRDRDEPWSRTCPRSYRTIEDAMYSERGNRNFYHDGESWTKV